MIRGGLLIPAGQQPPAPAVLSAVPLDQAAQLPVRDEALQQALAHDLPPPVSLGLNPPPESVPLAWRPDGKVLAILNQNNGITLRATATGRIVKAVGYIEPPPSALPP